MLTRQTYSWPTYAQFNSSNIASQPVQPFLGGMGGIYAAQFAPSVSVAPLASDVNHNRSSGHYNESHTSQGQLSWLTKLAENLRSELPIFSAPSTGEPIDLIIDEVDSEPEPNDDDSIDNDLANDGSGYGGDGQTNDHIACDEGSPWPSNVTPSL